VPCNNNNLCTAYFDSRITSEWLATARFLSNIIDLWRSCACTGSLNAFAQLPWGSLTVSPSIGERLKSVRDELGETQKSISLRFRLGVSTWAYLERDGRLPKSETLEELAKLGFSMEWLVAGRGTIMVGDPAQPTPLNGDLMGRIFDGLAKLYKEENQRLPPLDQGRIAAEIYSGLAGIDDEAERRGALRYALESRRMEMRQAVINPASSKRQA
jgi:transcriptional regulator with XRE-family HTH domain